MQKSLNVEVSDQAWINVSTTPLWQWGAGNVYLLVLSNWKENIVKNPIAIKALPFTSLLSRYEYAGPLIIPKGFSNPPGLYRQD